MSDVPFKICGLTRAEDAARAETAGAAYGGVILASGSPRTVSPERAAELFDGRDLLRVGVVVNASIAEMQRAVEVARLDVLQLHGEETPEFAEQARDAIDVMIWKGLRPRSGEEFRAAVEAFGEHVDGILLDGWSREARGGTGHKFPWEAVAPYRDTLSDDVQLIVAGGLRAGNVAEAIRVLRPDALDVCSGVESQPGIKDPNRIQDFAAAVQGAASPQKVG